MSNLTEILQRSSTRASRDIDVTALWSIAKKRARRARVLAAVGVVIVVAASSVAAATVDLGGPAVQRPPIGGETNEPTEKETPPDDEGNGSREPRSCSTEGVLCISLDRDLSTVGAGFGTAWVGNIGEGPTFGIARFDAESGEEIARITPNGFVEDFAVDDRWMWALMSANENLSVLKIDPETTEIADEIDIGPAGNIGRPSMVAGGGYAWVSGPEATLTRLSETDGTRTDFSYGDELAGYSKDNGPLHLAYGEGRVWLSYGAGHVGSVDPRSGELVRVLGEALGVNAYEIVYAAGRLWSPHQTPEGANVVKYVSTNGSVASQGAVQLQEAPPGKAATDGDHVWVVQDSFSAKNPGWLVEVDGETQRVVGEPMELTIVFMGSVAVDDDYVWVTGKNVLYRITR